ncbi:MAG: Fic family protein [Thermoleophilia bacterium]
MIREIHKYLVKGVRGGSAAPGKYRIVQNYVVNSLTGDVIYTPPPANEVPIVMAEMVAWLNKKSEIPAVLVVGIAQHQLVNIHPFLDGNGRTARLLSTLCLYRSGYDFRRLFTISEYYDRDRPAYYQAIQDVRESKMDLTGWLEYFTQGLAAQLLEVRERGELVIRTDLILAKGRKAGLNERQVDLLSYLLKRGRGTIAEFETELKLNRRTLQRDLKLLGEKGLSRKVGTSPTDPTRHYEPIL